MCPVLPHLRPAFICAHLSDLTGATRILSCHTCIPVQSSPHHGIHLIAATYPSVLSSHHLTAQSNLASLSHHYHQCLHVLNTMSPPCTVCVLPVIHHYPLPPCPAEFPSSPPTSSHQPSRCLCWSLPAYAPLLLSTKKN